MEYLGGPGSMEMILDQIRENPRVEVSNIKGVKWPLRECFENCDMRKLGWKGQELQRGDTVFWMDEDLNIFKVKIFVERMDPEEQYKLTVQQNLENAEAAMKEKREAGIGVCSGPDCGKIFDDKGYNVGAF